MSSLYINGISLNVWIGLHFNSVLKLFLRSNIAAVHVFFKDSTAVVYQADIRYGI